MKNFKKLALIATIACMQSSVVFPNTTSPQTVQDDKGYLTQGNVRIHSRDSRFATQGEKAFSGASFFGINAALLGGAVIAGFNFITTPGVASALKNSFKRTLKPVAGIALLAASYGAYLGYTDETPHVENKTKEEILAAKNT